MASSTMIHLNNPRANPVFAESSTTHSLCSFTTLSEKNKVARVSTSTRKFLKKSYVASISTPKIATCKACKLALTSRWREVQGLYNWENLIEPFDPLLRQEVIRYGKFVATCYEAFDLNPNSRRYLNCKYGRKSLLEEVGMGDSGYEVTKYIYATPEVNVPMIMQNGNCCGRWVGYIAVSLDEEVNKLGRRDVLVTFRGTVTQTEWIANLMSSLTPARLDPHNPRLDVKVGTGFLNLYTSNESETRFGLGSCREQLLSEVSRLLSKYKDEELSITIAGHSMGSSLALLLAYDLAELGLNIKDSKNVIPITVFSFAGPRVGNSRFKERCDALGVKTLRIVNAKDPITKLPGVLFNENSRNFGGCYEVPWRRSCYVHVGVELVLDFCKMENIFNVHDLETYIRLLKCPKKPELQKIKVGLGLLNKAKEFIKKTRNDEISSWRDAAVNVVNMVLPQRTTN